MKRQLAYIPLLLSSLMLMLLCACSHDDGPSGEPAKLYIYVYSPDHPVVTRADIGDVTPALAEREVKSLQIWVFAHEAYTYNGITYAAGSLVGYLSPSGTDLGNINSGAGETYVMEVSDAFASEKPNVDVYVLSNVTNDNCGVALDAASTKAQLEAAMLKHEGTSDPFGLTSQATAVPADGLPMSGKLADQPIYGISPVLRIGSSSSIATVSLVRMVSKLRIVFTRLKSSTEHIEITGITLDGSINDDDTEATTHIPTQEYLFFDGSYNLRNYKIGSGYESGAVTISGSALDSYPYDDTDASHAKEIKYTEYVSNYVYTTEAGQNYENKINAGIASDELTEVGPFYLRETDRRLRGTISYKVDDVEHTVPFSLAQAGDFSRNHTWILFSYFHGGDQIRVLKVYISPWIEMAAIPHEVYNW